MNSRERVLKALNFEEPDMIPVTELDIDINLMERILRVKIDVQHSLQAAVVPDRKSEMAYCDSVYKAYEKMELDILYAQESLPDGYALKKLPDGSFVDQIGRVYGYDEVAKAYTPIGTIFDTPEDVERFLQEDFPDANVPGRDFGFRYLKKLNKAKKSLGIFIREPFAHVWEALTPVKFVRWMHTNPLTIKKFIDKVTEFNLGLIKIYGELGGADLIVMAGDLCDTNGPILPPEQFRRFGVFGAMRRHVEIAHKYGIKFIKHTDGYVIPLMEDLVNDARVDGLHSLDPSTGVDIKEIKEKYRDRLILHGNVSVDNLSIKSEEEITEEVKYIINVASPGGGHILSSSNSWYGGVKLENCYAMVKARRKYGRYPIRIRGRVIPNYARRRRGFI